jgi:putative ABC transport system permease protein
MLRSYFKLAWRSIVKDRQFALLNLIGLSTGLACSIAIYLWVIDESSINKFNKDDDRRFQIMKNSESSEGIYTDERTPGLLADGISKEIPEVEYSTPVIPVSWFDKKGLLLANGRSIAVNAQFAGPDYFKIFPYRILQGNKDHLLSQKNAIVISDALAKKLFNTSNGIVGKSVQWNQQDYTGTYLISGIFEKPKNTSIEFDIVFNYNLFLDKNPKLLNWRNNDPSTYVILKKDADIKKFNDKLADYIKKKRENSTVTLFAQRYADTHLYNNYENGVAVGGRIHYVRLFSIIAIFILIIACVNFMNLSTAKASVRVKEVGVKKVMGAGRRVLVVQYLAESIILASVAMCIALALVALLLPEFNEITGKQLKIHARSEFIFAIVGITLITGFIAGSYPALYLSAFKPIVILRAKMSVPLNEVFVRKALVVLQFSLSAVFIISVIVVYRQMHFIQTKNLGYQRDHIIYFEKGGMLTDKKEELIPGNTYEKDLETYLERIRTIPGVINAANFRHNITNREGGTYDLKWPGKDEGSRINFTDLGVGYDFVETVGIELKTGRAFSRYYGSEKSTIIFNEAAIETMGMKDPIGKTVRIGDEERVIIGVVANFHFRSLHENVTPCYFDLSTNERASKIMVKIEPGKEAETIARLAKLHKETNTIQPFEYRFLDEDYEALYSSEKKVAELSKYFAAMAIIISSLGLFGLAAFTAQKRQREIGIRKVVGASVNGIVLLLSKDFLQLVLIAIIISFPLAWLATSKWLEGFAYRISLGGDVFLLAGLAILLISLLTVSLQSMKAALSSPVKALRSE